MNSLRTAVFGALAIASSAIAQFVEAPSDLTSTKGNLDLTVRYKEVPHGICELTPGVKSFSGYVDVAENQHSFFWFFEARDVDPKEAPLSIWINGGPGSSSMIGLFQEMGPCRISKNGKVLNNRYAWNKVSNMIYIDQPTTVGFSYSKAVKAYLKNGDVHPLEQGETTCPEKYAKSCGTWSIPDTDLTANSTDNAAPNFWKTLQGFMGAFPQYSQKGLNFATESYGGHYGPVFADYIVRQNEKKIPGAAHINMDTLLIGNGWFDPLLQYPTYFDFAVKENTFMPITENKTKIATWQHKAYGKGQCEDQLKKCYATGTNKDCIAADNFCYSQVEYKFDKYSGRDEYDLRELTPDPFPPEFYVDYLNTPKVLSAIGAFTNFSEFSPTTGSAFATTGDDARDPNTKGHLRHLLNNNVQVVLYDGDADYICNWYGVYLYSLQVEYPGFDTAGFAPMKTSDGIRRAEVKQSGLFSFVRVYESGHEVPFYQPLQSLQMFWRAIRRRDIETGLWKLDAVPGYKTDGPLNTTYREGKDTVQFKVWPKGSIYNTTTNQPQPPKGGGKLVKRETAGTERRGLARFRHQYVAGLEG